jgi:hypothetical protein
MQQQMGSAICRHLPLITPCIEFTPKRVSELPDITPWICFNAHQTRALPDIADDPDSMIGSDTDMDDIESGEEVTETKTPETKIPKPAGVVGPAIEWRLQS